MCDEDTERDNARAFAAGQLTRREFAATLTGLAAAVALWPTAAHAGAVVDAEVNITTADGVADAYFAHPATGRAPGVIVWPDIRGLRPAFRAMGKRLAEAGYAVLVVNPFYRASKAPIVDASASFQDPEVRARLMGLARELTAAITTADAIAFARFLDAQPAVDTARRIGTMGYCMGGPMTVRTAAALPARVGAAASFHGGGLVTDAPDSPHRLIASTQASFLFAIATNDDTAQPDAKTALREASAAANRPAEVEVYEGAMHGWCPPDSPVYNAAQAERAWTRLLALFAGALS